MVGDDERPTRCDWCGKVATSPLDFARWPDPDGKPVDVHMHCYEAWLMDKKRHNAVVTWERLADLAAGACDMDDFADRLRREANGNE